MLDNKKVNEYLAELGYSSVKDFQKDVLYPQYVDGIYGPQTENALISAINVKRNTKNFSVKEFRCECGGKYCCGYPSTLKVEMLRNIQAIRDHYGRPITVTCGLRDKVWNSKLGGSIQNSLHLCGQAVDFYQSGVTDTLANRKASIRWIKTLPNHHYTYGNGINSYGNGVSAPYMGNALHTDVSVAVSPYDENGKLKCDGVGGAATVKEMQRFFGTTKDGIISGQNKSLKKYYPALTSVQFGTGGSPCIRNLQRWVGTTQDGVLGINTVKAWQKKLIAEEYLAKGQDDGIFGAVSVKAWQKYLNEHEKADYPKETIVDKELAACKTQAEWMRNSKYEYEKNPTIEKSKKKGTCVTYVACVLQRIGILKSGQNLWHDENNRVYGNNSKMTVTYPGNKTLSQLKSQLKAGDIIMDGSGVGSGSHIFILTGKWNGNKPVIWDNHSGQQNKGAYTYGRDRKVIAIVRLK